MIINHNMASLNTYRQMSTNMANSSKSLEKLSSGLRINKAGDDAAGLAISEKMRGQIRGLDQAARNGQDGISMLNTAEGALGETHSILQRMKELATQSANDTNTGSDRSEIQKEMNQLTSEVNRIGNTTEFNTQKLLKGSVNPSSIGSTASGSVDGVNAVAGVQAAWNSTALTAVSADGTGTVSFNGVTINITADDTGTGSVVSGATGTSANLALDYTGTTGDDTDDKQLTQIKNAFDQVKAVSGSPLANFTFSVDTTNHKLVITDSFTDGSKNNALNFTATGDVSSMSGGTKTAGADEVLAKAASNSLTFDKAPTEGSTFKVAGKTVAFYDSTSGKYSNASAAATALTATSSAYVIDINGKNTSDIAAAVAGLDFTATGGTGATAAVVGNKVTFSAQTVGTAQTAATDITLNDAHKGSQTTYTAGAGAANTNLSGAAGDDFQMSISVGSKTFTVDTSKLNTNLTGIATYGSAQQATVIDALGSATATDGTKLSDLVDISFDNGASQTLNLKAKGVGTDNITTVLTGTDAAAVDTALGINAGTATGTAGTTAYADGGKAFTATFQVGANTSQSMTIEVNDMRSQALKISGTSAGAEVTATNGTKATLKATKDVTDGTNNTTTEYALDVSTHEKATAAISVLDDAIQSVSAERSKIGAYTNRLDHTITNLGTSSENLTAAESRVRDVDMAKEMMQFQKNNILSQAAQAMMAQANQQPQGVLQLLR